jgi:hypothetical protein
MTELTFTLDDQRIIELERLSALGYTPEEMALYFDVDKVFFVQAALNVESKVYYHIKRGKILALAKEQMALLDDAEKGEVQSIDQISKIRRDKGWETSRLDMFGGFIDKRLIQNIQDYLDSGSVGPLKSDERLWLDCLTLAAGLQRKIGRRNAVSFFHKTYDMKLSQAQQLVDEAVSLFYRERFTDRKSMRHLLAENILESAIIVRDNASSSSDWKVYTEMQLAAAKLLRLEEKEEDQLDDRLFQKPIRVYSLDVENVGLPAPNRHLLAQQIDSLEVPEREKIRLRQEALIEPINLEERLNGLEKES